MTGLVRRTLANVVIHLETRHDQIVTLKMDKQLLGVDKDVVMLFSYVPPYDSPYYVTAEFGNGIDLLEQCLHDVHDIVDDFYILLCGDLNARTGSLNCPCESTARSQMEEESLLERKSSDTTINPYGRKLLYFCHLFDCSILNGAKFFNADEAVTFISQAGSSLIDYFCASNELCGRNVFMSLQVESRADSDHLPVTLTVRTTRTDGSTPRAQGEWVEKLVWDGTKTQLYLDALHSRESQEKLSRATGELDTDVDRALGLFVECLQSAATCMVKKVFVGGRPRKKNWFDAECTQAKKVARSCLRTFKKKKSAYTRQQYV